MKDLIAELRHTLPDAYIEISDSKITVKDHGALVNIILEHGQIKHIAVYHTSLVNDKDLALFLGTVYSVAARYDWKSDTPKKAPGLIPVA